MKDVVFLYNKKRSLFCGAKKSDTVPDSISEPFVIPQTAEAQFPLAPVAVVIPACSEYPGILKTFESIKESAVYAYNKIGRSKSFSSKKMPTAKTEAMLAAETATALCIKLCVPLCAW